MSDAALLSLIENYCREAGVRNLHKHIEKIYRKVMFLQELNIALLVSAGFSFVYFGIRL